MMTLYAKNIFVFKFIGLHPENHGMVENYMLDPIYNEEFRLGQNEDQFNAHWWDSGEPLWVTAEKQVQM